MMPRLRRQLSKTQIYHIMIRGNKKEDIFIDEEDKTKFIDILAEKKKSQAYLLYAFCLMNNHIHLLIKENQDPIARIMRRINTSYAVYFNKKYKRVGHVFQDRFKSEPIESEAYLLAVVRYIHSNPVKAKMVKCVSNYEWSSYPFYINQTDLDINMVESKEILDIFSLQHDEAVKLFTEYTNEQNDDIFIDCDAQEDLLIKEEDVHDFIKGFLEQRQKKSELSVLNADKNLRNELIRELKQRSDLSGRKIADTLEIGRNIVQRIK